MFSIDGKAVKEDLRFFGIDGDVGVNDAQLANSGYAKI